MRRKKLSQHLVLSFWPLDFSYFRCDKPDIGMHFAITVKILIRKFNRA
jgi:hypothetical protein